MSSTSSSSARGGRLRSLPAVATALAMAALVSAVQAGPAQAKGPVTTFPPTTMAVSCSPFSTVTANVPPRTKLVTYSYFKADPYFDYGMYQTPQQPGYGYTSFESGPGYTAPLFPAVWQKGGSTYPTDPTSVMVMATAYSSERATKVLAFGFAPCFGKDPIPIVFSYGGSTYRYLDGAPAKVG